MRTLAAALTTAQKRLDVDSLYKIQLTYAANDDTYEEDRILSINHIEESYHQEATVVLDNSDLAITQDYRAYKGVLSYGLAPPRASNYSACAPLWVISQENHSSEELLTVTLTLKGLPDLLAEDRASEQYTQESGDTQTVKTLLTAVVAATLAPFNHTVAYTATFDSEDSLVDTFAPADSFEINLNETRLEIIKRLLFYWKGAMRVEADGAVHFFVPTVDGDTWVATTAYSVNDYVQPVTPNNNFTYRCTTAGTTAGSEPTWPTVAGNTVADGTVVWTAVGFDYEYKVDVPGDHDLFAKSHRRRVVQPNYIEVSSNPDSDDAYTGFAEDTDSSDLTEMEKREHYYLRLASNAQATALAKAILQTYQLDAQLGSASVPINVGQEVHDYVKLTDSRQDDIRIGNVRHLQRIIGNGEWNMYLSFGDVRQGRFLGLFPEISPVAITDMEGGGTLAPTLESLAAAFEAFSVQVQGILENQGRLISQLGADSIATKMDIFMIKQALVSSMQHYGVVFDRFTADGTWTKPTGVKVVHVVVIGAGGGGGPGRTAAAGTVRQGGSGGGGGAMAFATYLATDLAATEAVVIGAAGAGGVVGVSNGVAGGTSNFGTKLYAYGGGGGIGPGTPGTADSGGGGGGGGAVGENGAVGAAVNGGGPGATGNASNGGFGGAGSGSATDGSASAYGGAGGGGVSATGATAYKGGSSLHGGPGGAGAGGVTIGNAESAGEAGGLGATITAGGGGTGGVVGGGAGGAGGAGTTLKRGSGGGGGGGNAAATAGIGGAGGAPGGGGGGGGGGITGNNGGAGGRGEVLVWSWGRNA